MEATQRMVNPQELKARQYSKLLPRLSDEQRALLRDSIREIGLQQSIDVDPDLVVLDGHERLGICIELGMQEVPVRVVEGLDEEWARRRYIVASNMIVRQPTTLQRRQIAEHLLLEDPVESDRVISNLAGCSHSSVSTWRAQMEAANLIPHVLHHRGGDGKLRAVKAKPGRTATDATDELQKYHRQTPPPPDPVLAKAVTALTRHTSGRPDSTVAVIPAALMEMDMCRSVWDAEPATEPATALPPNLPLDEIDRLPAGQLEAGWLDPTTVQIRRGGTPIAHIRVRRAARSDDSFIRPHGSVRSEGWMGILNSCSHGCLRRAVGLPATEVPCHADAHGRGGCFVDALPCSKRPEFAGGQVILNGLTNDLLRITLPQDGDPSLDDRVPPDRVDEIMTWRVDCESSTGDLSISLGLLQRWCEVNPTHRFVTVCSDHFRPSDAMLSWLAALGNVIVGHSMSASLHPEEIESRFAAIERFLGWGIPTVIWIVTDPEWNSESVASRAAELVGPECIIEEPHILSPGRQRPPVLDTNPAGPCSSHRFSRKDGELVFVPGEDAQPGEYLVPLADGGYESPKGRVHARCHGCELRCGLAVHGMMERREVDETPVLDLTPIIHTPFPTADRLGYEVLPGDARDLVRSLPEVHCVLTSPPYFNIKGYGSDLREIGREAEATEYIETLCDIFDAIPLHRQGSLWVNLRDKRDDRVLRCIPERFMLAMRDRGWKLLDRVVWAKAALLPDGRTHGGFTIESVPWRLNGNGWEYVLRFSRTNDPWYDACGALIPRVNGDEQPYAAGEMELPMVLDGRIPPDVWLYGRSSGREEHVAPMPEVVCEIPIALSCPLWVNPDRTLADRVVRMTQYDDGRGPRKMGKYTHPELRVEGAPHRNDTDRECEPRKPESLGWIGIQDGAEPGICLDPFMGVGTTGAVALRLGRRFVGIDLYEQNCERARERLEGTLRTVERSEWGQEAVVAHA